MEINAIGREDYLYESIVHILCEIKIISHFLLEQYRKQTCDTAWDYDEIRNSCYTEQIMWGDPWRVDQVQRGTIY